MLTQSNSSENNKSSGFNINKIEDHRNRGIEFLLNGGKGKQKRIFNIIFEKIVWFLKWKVTVYFEFSIKTSRIKKNVSN